VDAVVHVCALLQQASSTVDRDAAAAAVASSWRSRAAPGASGGTASASAVGASVVGLAAAQRKAHFYAAYANDATAFTEELQEALLRDTWTLAMEQVSLQSAAPQAGAVRIA